MKILAVDTSTRMGSIALLDGENLLAETLLNVLMTHSERLLPSIEDLLSRTGLKISDLDGLALSIGPGSFTGLRIGLATLKGLAYPNQLPIVGISSLLALAYNGSLSEKPVAAVLDAKRKEVYAAVYQFKNGIINKIILDETVIKPETLCNTLRNFGPCWLLGDGACTYEATFKESLGENALWQKGSPLRWIQARWVGLLALPRLLKKEGENWQSLSPNYIRLSDARSQMPDPKVPGEGGMEYGCD